MRTGLIRVLAMILGHYVGRVLEFVAIGIVPLEIEVVSRPVHFVLKSATREPRVEYVIDYLLFLIIDNNRVGGDQLLTRQRVLCGYFQKSRIKDVVNTRGFR